MALAMTYAGAREETARQMASTLHFTLSRERLHPAFNALDLELAGRGEGLEEEQGDGFRLNVANSIWGQKDYTFLPEFLDVLALNYGAGLRLLDFVMFPERSRITINDWVSDQTEGRIEDLLPQGTITPLTRLVLTNAIYFKASWKTPFLEQLTRDGVFHTLNGRDVTVSMMSLDTEFGYTRAPSCQAVELLYLGEQLSMVILVPDSGAFEEFEAALDAEQLRSLLRGLASTRVQLSMPKFQYEFTLPLKATLMGLGMEDPFSEFADFSGMDGSRRLFIHDVRHKAFIAVDEKGTEAAAATAVTVGVTSVPPAVTIDRPFIFLIRDLPTGTVLFLGRVVDPGS
jgi:serpin B